MSETLRVTASFTAGTDLGPSGLQSGSREFKDPLEPAHTPSPLPSPSQFAAQLRSRVSPAFKQAPLEPHPLCGLDFCPTNCHVNLMEVSYPKTTPSVGRSFSIRFGRKPSLIGLDPEQGTCVCLLDLVLELTLRMRKWRNV